MAHLHLDQDTISAILKGLGSDDVKFEKGKLSVELPEQEVSVELNSFSIKADAKVKVKDIAVKAGTLALEEDGAHVEFSLTDE